MNDLRVMATATVLCVLLLAGCASRGGGSESLGVLSVHLRDDVADLDPEAAKAILAVISDQQFARTFIYSDERWRSTIFANKTETGWLVGIRRSYRWPTGYFPIPNVNFVELDHHFHTVRVMPGA